MLSTRFAFEVCRGRSPQGVGRAWVLRWWWWLWMFFTQVLSARFIGASNVLKSSARTIPRSLHKCLILWNTAHVFTSAPGTNVGRTPTPTPTPTHARTSNGQPILLVPQPFRRVMPGTAHRRQHNNEAGDQWVQRQHWQHWLLVSTCRTPLASRFILLVSLYSSQTTKYSKIYTCPANTAPAPGIRLPLSKESRYCSWSRLPFPALWQTIFFMSTLLLEPSSTRDDLATTRIIPSLPHTLRSSSSTSASVPFSTGMAFSLTSNAAGSYAWPNVSNSTKANKTLSSEWLPGCMLSVVGAQWSAKHIFDGWFSAAREQPPGNYHPYYAKLCCGPKKWNETQNVWTTAGTYTLGWTGYVR